MRIACVSTILGYPWGSPDRLWCELGARCLERGDALFVAVSPLTADSAAMRDLERKGALVFLRQANSVFLGRMDQWLRRLPGRRMQHIDFQLQDFRPDVVVITQGATYDALAEAYLVDWLERSGAPFVLICHNNREDAVLGAQEISRARRFLEGAAALLFVSSHNRATAERQLGVPLPQARFIQNPLAFDDPGLLAWPEADGTAHLGLVGRIDINHKGIDLLFEALASLKASFPFVVTLTGRCEEPDAIRELLRRFALTDRVRLHEPVSGAGVTQCYGAMELFLLTSRYEGCASAMLEALMCGRPVLATPIGGVSDWIEDGVNGFVTAGITVSAIRDSLVRALSCRPQWRAMGGAARRAFAERRDSDPAKTLQGIMDNAVNPVAPLASHA